MPFRIWEQRRLLYSCSKQKVILLKVENDLGRDKISRLVFRIAIPSMMAQFVSVLYSIVDRMFVGNIPEIGSISLAGVGVCGPVVTMISAFAFLVGVGGAPLMGIALGSGNRPKAQRIVANCFALIVGISVVVTILALALREPMLRLFGASDVTYPYAESYFTVYVSGTIFNLISIGMGQFIYAQGYAKVGMTSVIIGAVMNIILDPIFIYVFHMGVRGAAMATILSQAVSASFVLFFLLRKADIRITIGRYSTRLCLRILQLGLTPFLIIAFDNVMIIGMNAMLQKYGGAAADDLITVNTIVQSFMLVLTMPLGGISGGTQCILSFNYGAGQLRRVAKAQRYIIAYCMSYAALLMLLAWTAGPLFVSLFTSDAALVPQACQAIKICAIAIIPLGAQYEIVDGFTGMGRVKISLPLSIWRKAVFFVSIFTIPVAFGASAIFYAEPISDILAILVSTPVYFWSRKRLLAHEALPESSEN